jgi:3'-5' exoribonuclease
MKSQYIQELKSGQAVKEKFILSKKILKEKKNGGSFALLEFSDKTGSIEAVAWDNVIDKVNAIAVGDCVFVAGSVNEYNERLQIVVSSISSVDETDFDPDDFLPSSTEDIEAVMSEIDDIRHTVRNVHLKKLLTLFFDDKDFVRSFRTAPAAKRAHHAYLGGLAVHTRNVCRLAMNIQKVYSDLNVDLLITASILHDVGKITEYIYKKKLDISTEGRMIGHIVMGYEMVAERIKHVPDFPSDLKLRLLHMVLSHHGELEWGSPRLPVFIEALVLHFADNLDSKVGMMSEEQRKPGSMNRSWSDYHPYLEREIYLGERP